MSELSSLQVVNSKGKLACKTFSYPNWNDVAGAVDHREARVHQHLPQKLHAPLMLPPERLALLALQDLYGLSCPGQEHRGQGGGEDEARGVGAHGVHQVAGAGDVAAHAAKGFPWRVKRFSFQTAVQ